MKKADKYIIIGIFILLLISSLWVFIYKSSKDVKGSQAVISKDGNIIETIDLSLVKEPYEFTIKSKNNGYNTIYVEKDKIKFIEANCPDKLCVKTGLLTNTSDIAVCLPHGIIIEIKNGKDGQMDSLAN